MNCVLWSMGDASLHGIGTSLVPASLSGVTHVAGLNCYLCVRTVPVPRLTLIRPPVVNRESSPAAGCFPREKDTTWGPRGAADFISRAASDTVVCTKHLLRLELETTTCSRHQRGEQPRLRGLETHLCPPAGRLK